jgi:preprotein translocase subunit SecA
MTDDIMRLFGSERIMGMMEALKVDDDTPLDHKMLSNAIEQAQKTVESRNFQTRKTVLEYDDVMNKQRGIIYGERRKVLDGEDLQQQIMGMIREFVSSTVTDGLHGEAAETQQQLDEAKAYGEKISKETIQLTMKAGEGGRVFGSVSTKEIVTAAKQQFGFDIDKKKVVISNPIKNTGMFKTRVKLHPQVSADINVEVVTGA